MKKLLAALAVVGLLSVASPAQAATAYEPNMNKAHPITLTQTDTNGVVTADVWYASGVDPTVRITDASGTVLYERVCPAYYDCLYNGIDVPVGGVYTVTVFVTGGRTYAVTVQTDE